MAQRNNAYYREKERMKTLGRFQAALESARQFGATHLSFPTTSSYTFQAFRQVNNRWESCYYCQNPAGFFRSSGNWHAAQLPPEADLLQTILDEEIQITAYRHKEQSGLTTLYQAAKSLRRAYPSILVRGLPSRVDNRG